MTFRTTSIAYLAALEDLVDRPQFRVSPRGLPCREVLDYRLAVEEPSDGPVVTMDLARNAVLARYLEAEVRLYLSGERRATVWAAEASKFWGGLADADGNVTSNYGYLMLMNRSLPGGLTPWEWARESLLRDRDSRQAFVRVSLPEHQYAGNPDQPCTMHVMYAVRDGLLRSTAVMRSCDVVRGLAYDMPWFCRCHLRMAREVGAGVGPYAHLAHSLHLYDRDLPTALSMLGRTA